MRNPYDTLGIKRDAGEGDIRKAFRRLAKQWHPDMKPGDSEAESRFREINAAYDLLSDPAKRARFDRGEIDAEGNERFAHAQAGQGSSGFGAGAGSGGFGFHFNESHDIGDLFGSLFGERFGGRGGAPAHDLRSALTVDFLDVANGATRRVTVDGRAIDLSIPAGIEDGTTLRLKGQGGQGGDLLVEIHVHPHPLFRRVGNDIHLDLPITLGEAVQGARVTVPTIGGRVALTIRKGANTGSVLRLKGKGIKGGDQYVTVKVVLPDHIDEELAAFVDRWSPRHPYHPRDHM